MAQRSWSIRTAVPSEFARLREIYREASLSNEGDRDALLAYPEEFQLPESALLEGRIRVATAPAPEGTIVGFATTIDTGEALELEDLFTDPAWMRQGIATALIADAVTLTRQA